jgi:hypothetical protein
MRRSRLSRLPCAARATRDGRARPVRLRAVSGNFILRDVSSSTPAASSASNGWLANAHAVISTSPCPLYPFVERNALSAARTTST